MPSFNLDQDLIQIQIKDWRKTGEDRFLAVGAFDTESPYCPKKENGTPYEAMLFQNAALDFTENNVPVGTIVYAEPLRESAPSENHSTKYISEFVRFFEDDGGLAEVVPNSVPDPAPVVATVEFKSIRADVPKTVSYFFDRQSKETGRPKSKIVGEYLQKALSTL